MPSVFSICLILSVFAEFVKRKLAGSDGIHFAGAGVPAAPADEKTLYKPGLCGYNISEHDIWRKNYERII